MPVASQADYEAMEARIYRWAYRLLQNDHDALDATQSVLMKMLNIPFAAPEKRTAWLRRVTINHCIDQIRQRRTVHSLCEAIVHEPIESAEIERSERRDQIVSALQQLTEPQRIVLLSKAYDGETFDAIAQALGISISSVKTHYVRALRKMRELLAYLRESWP